MLSSDWLRKGLDQAVEARDISRRTPAPAHVIYRALRRGFTRAEVEKGLDWVLAHGFEAQQLCEFLETMKGLRQRMELALLYGTGSAEPRGFLSKEGE